MHESRDRHAPGRICGNPFGSCLSFGRENIRLHCGSGRHGFHHRQFHVLERHRVRNCVGKRNLCHSPSQLFLGKSHPAHRPHETDFRAAPVLFADQSQRAFAAGFRSSARGNPEYFAAARFRRGGMQPPHGHGPIQLHLLRRVQARLLCNAVLPEFRLRGSPGEFIYIMLAYEDSSRALDFAYAGEESNYAALSSGFSYEKAAKYAEAVSALEAAAKNASNSAILGYSFCNPPDYGAGDMAAVDSFLQNRVRSSAPFYLAQNYSDVVRNRTVMALAKEEQRQLPPRIVHPAAPVPSAPAAPAAASEGSTAAAAIGEKSILQSPKAALAAALAAAVSISGWLLIAYASLSQRSRKGKNRAQMAAKK